MSQPPSHESARPGSRLRVAVASKEGQAISEHFGHARHFLVYTLNAHACRLLERREVAHYCLGQSADAGALHGILAALHDCQAVFVARIGDGPRARLAARGVSAVASYAWEPIDSALHDYARRHAAGERPT